MTIAARAFTPEIRAALDAEWRELQSDCPGLRGWTLELTPSADFSDPHGRCYFARRLIVIFPSPLADDLAADESIDTLRHEAAHALAGAVGHNSVWRQFAKMLGATPSARCER